MNKPTRLVIGICLVGCAGFLVALLRTGAPPEIAAGKNGQSAVMQSPVTQPLAVNSNSQPLPAKGTALLPQPQKEIPSAPGAGAPAAFNIQAPVPKVRPPEESMLSSWAARDPEGAGRWLNQNRDHPKFADMVRGYAIQIATIDPAAARQWAAELKGSDSFFTHGGTLEQHIDALEAMLAGPDAAQIEQPQRVPEPFFPADYTPVLVRQNPDELPVLEMQPTSPI
ncbi:MAG: hypothetical protein O3C21_19895 [Verrucomicrobia bacterium]|nr:hypothetical protein [Verrucomicrobiota bacterium]